MKIHISLVTLALVVAASAKPFIGKKSSFMMSPYFDLGMGYGMMGYSGIGGYGHGYYPKYGLGLGLSMLKMKGKLCTSFTELNENLLFVRNVYSQLRHITSQLFNLPL